MRILRWRPSLSAPWFRSVRYPRQPRRGTTRSASRVTTISVGSGIAASTPTSSARRRPRDAGPIAMRILTLASRTGRVALIPRAG